MKGLNTKKQNKFYEIYFELFFLICSITHTRGFNPKNAKEKSRNKIITGLIGKFVMSIYKVYVIPDIATIRLTITIIRVPIFFFIVR